MSELCVDFGTSNTVLVLLQGEQATPLFLPEVGRWHPTPEGQAVPLIASLIAYPSAGEPLLGEEVVRRGLREAPVTFRWLKHYLLHDRNTRVWCADGSYRDVRQAAGEFLTGVLTRARAAAPSPVEGVVFAVPVEAHEPYAEWLSEVAVAAGLPRCRFLDEPTAAALAYGVPLTGGACAVFDFGGGTLDLSIVRWETEDNRPRAVVVGKAGQPTLGGKTLDQWFYEWVVRAAGYRLDDPWIEGIGRSLLWACERAKEELSAAECTTVAVTDPEGNRTFTHPVTRVQWEAECERRGLYTLLHQTIRRALSAARDHGVPEEEVGAVVPVGGSSLMPGVLRVLRQAWGEERLRSGQPLDAVARGAAGFAAGLGLVDHIQHDYALRHWDPVHSTWAYQVLVPAGTPYPQALVARWTLGATHPQQQRLGLEVWQVSRHQRHARGPNTELVFDPSGGVQIVSLSPETAFRAERWLNEASPTFIEADPPADPGQERFLVEFGISAEKQLRVSVFDRQRNGWTLQDCPLVRLR